MKNEIKFQSKECEGKKGDFYWIDEFYKFLQGEVPKDIFLDDDRIPKLTEEQAANVLWYLQEHLSVLPEHFDVCDNCGCLYDAHNSGTFWESGKPHWFHFCDSCEHLVPEDEDQ